MGPRGTTTIVFGLLAFNKLPEDPAADTILVITVVCVLGNHRRAQVHALILTHVS